MRLRFQADADLNQNIVLAVLRREPSVDFKTAEQARLKGIEDPKVLALAATSERILVTHDRRTMPRHFADFIADRTSPGLLLIPQKIPVAIAAEELVLIWAVSEPGEWVDRICALPL